MQRIVLNKTLDLISLERRRNKEYVLKEALSRYVITISLKVSNKTR